MALRIFSFFSGSGFLDLGFEDSDYRIDLVNEFSPSFRDAYQYARRQMNLSHKEQKTSIVCIIHSSTSY